MKVLFICNHRPNRSPGQRFRFEQYLNHLAENGITYDLSFILNEKDDKVLYLKGKYLQKALIFIKSYFIRFKDLLRANQFDIIFIYREAILTRSTIFEYLLSKTKAKLILDFDDAIWLPNISEQNKKLEWIKNYDKTSQIAKLADTVIVGNAFLKNYALNYNNSVIIIPTTIDTSYHVPIKKHKETICIGWTGSHTTMKHFDLIIPALKKIKIKYGELIYFKVIGDPNYKNEDLNITGYPWRLSSEIEDLQEIDIGIMPLPDDEWSKGKCGFKSLQYMSLEIPTIMSPVGVNTEIIEDGKNGLLASSEKEWINKLSSLIESEELRIRLGKEGRKTVLEKYSVVSQKEKYLSIFNSLVSNSKII
jgi:glycosyltransferase involved in cell wall biosynthesis